MTEFFQNVLIVMGPLLLTLLGYVAVQIEISIKRKTGLQIEGYHRDALHSALNTGASLALAWAARQDTEPTLLDLKRHVVEYAKRSVPDALTYLGAEFDQLIDMSTAKLEEKMSAS